MPHRSFRTWRNSSTCSFRYPRSFYLILRLQRGQFKNAISNIIIYVRTSKRFPELSFLQGHVQLSLLRRYEKRGINQYCFRHMKAGPRNGAVYRLMHVSITRSYCIATVILQFVSEYRTVQLPQRASTETTGRSRPRRTTALLYLRNKRLRNQTRYVPRALRLRRHTWEPGLLPI